MNFILFSLLTATAFASWNTSGTWSTTADEGSYEVYGGSCSDWSGTSNTDLPNANDDLEGWIDGMDSVGYSIYKYGTDAEAWSTGWESSGDSSYADAADFGYVHTHGSTGYWVFNGSSGDDKVTASETSWGQYDVEAIAILSCKVLDSTGRSSFSTANKNKGIHFILGFSSNAIDYATVGETYAMYLDSGYTVASAWKYATKDTHSSSYTGAYVRFYTSSCNTTSDTAYSMACDPKSSSSSASSTWTL